MKKAILLGVSLCAVAWLAGGATTATTKKKSTKKRTHVAAAAARIAPKTRTTASKTSKGKTTATRTPARSRQLVPTKERYQQIQQALASKGYFSGEPSGVWGSDSTEALKRFQADQNLTPDGKLGSLSLIALGLGPKRLSAQSAAKPAPPTQQQ